MFKGISINMVLISYPEEDNGEIDCFSQRMTDGLDIPTLCGMYVWATWTAYRGLNHSSQSRDRRVSQTNHHQRKPVPTRWKKIWSSSFMSLPMYSRGVMKICRARPWSRGNASTKLWSNCQASETIANVFLTKMMRSIEAEVKFFIDFGFIREKQNPKRAANIVLVTKKNGKIRICINFRDLNEAFPKDEFSLPIMTSWLTILAVMKCMSFMDWFFRYNQIKIYLENGKHTSFRAPLVVYCYTVMPLGLKNMGATYQCAMDKTFQQHTRKIMECIVDDLAVKSHTKDDHLSDLNKVFDLNNLFENQR